MAKTEMEHALEADGEKLRALTGEDHGPWDFDSTQECWNCAGLGIVAGCFEDCCSGADCDPEDAEYCCLPSRCDVCKGKGGWDPDAPTVTPRNSGSET